MTVRLDESIKLGLMLADVLLLLPIEVLGLAALGLEVGQGKRRRLLECVSSVSRQVSQNNGAEGADLLRATREERTDGKAAAT